MVETLRTWIARKIAPRLFDEAKRREKDAFDRETGAFNREADIEQEINQRIAALMLKMDPFELVMREYRGVFGQDFEHPEDNLDARGVLNLRSFGYTIATDPSFNFLCDWIMNSQGNETLLKAAVTPERILYGRAQISAMLAFRKEVRRLSAAYEDMRDKQNGRDYDPTLSTE